MKKWSVPQLVGLKLEATQTTEGVYYKVAMSRSSAVQCTGVIKYPSGEAIQSCSDVFRASTVDEAVQLWKEHCSIVHSGHAANGEFLGHIGIS